MFPFDDVIMEHRKKNAPSLHFVVLYSIPIDCVHVRQIYTNDSNLKNILSKHVKCIE